jgi:uncharacterized membrane protein
MTEEENHNLQSSKAQRILPWILVVIVLIAAGIFSAAQYKSNKNLKTQVSQLKADPQKAAQDQTRELVNKVAQLVILPKDEEPTIATVTDVSKLKDQPFFANAQEGDKVLIYSTAKKAILYRESINKIIEVAPVNIGDNTTGVTPTKK